MTWRSMRSKKFYWMSMGRRLQFDKLNLVDATLDLDSGVNWMQTLCCIYTRLNLSIHKYLLDWTPSNLQEENHVLCYWGCLRYRRLRGETKVYVLPCNNILYLGWILFSHFSISQDFKRFIRYINPVNVGIILIRVLTHWSMSFPCPWLSLSIRVHSSQVKPSGSWKFSESWVTVWACSKETVQDKPVIIDV